LVDVKLSSQSGVDFTNVLSTAFTLVDPESIKNTVKSSVPFCAFSRNLRLRLTFRLLHDKIYFIGLPPGHFFCSRLIFCLIRTTKFSFVFIVAFVVVVASVVGGGVVVTVVVVLDLIINFPLESVNKVTKNAYSFSVIFFGSDGKDGQED